MDVPHSFLPHKVIVKVEKSPFLSGYIESKLLLKLNTKKVEKEIANLRKDMNCSGTCIFISMA